LLIMTEQNVIALIFDCDDTLCEDTTAFLLRELGIDVDTFWRSVNLMVRKGWDPPLAYMRKLIRMNRSGKIKLTNGVLRKTGAKIDFFPGIPEFFNDLREYLTEIEETKDLDIKIEYYVISSGFEELIRGSKIEPYVNDIFGCTFETELETGLVRFPKSIVTFTEKTKFVFAINKGIPGERIRRSPYEVNNNVELKDRRIPFCNMLYIGDGPSDIPCFSLLKNNKGYGIGVMEKKSASKAWQLAKGGRTTVGPYQRNYTESSMLRTMINQTVKDISKKISLNHQLQGNAAPRY
jgi:hypothetical protein